jgi:hypothetical protein
MVIKETILHSGWSYGNGDDQYDNESLGSTRTVVKKKKLVENSTSNKKNEYDEKMCSRQDDKHTNEQGWTTIEANKRKPKSKTSNNITLDSIISTIDIEFNIDTNGTLEATIDSPIRENRCVVPDKNVYDKKNTQETKEHEQGKPTILVEEEEGRNERTRKKKTSESNKNKENIKRKEQEKQYELQRHNKTTMSSKKKDTKAEEIKERLGAKSAEEENKEIGITKMATNGQQESTQNNVGGSTDESTSRSNNNSTTGEENTNENNKNTTNNGGNENTNNKNKNNNNGSNTKSRVSICTPAEMETYTFTISWRPEQKAGQDGKMIIKMLMREMNHRTPQIVFHPTNSASSPVPRDINNINNDFPSTSASYDDFFDQTRNRDNTNQRTFMKVTMPHDEKELQRKLHNYLFYNKLYMNSPFIDDNTLEQVGFIENGHSRLVYRPILEKKIRKGLQEVMEGDMLTPQQIAQLKHLSSSIRVECHRGTVRAGPNQQQVVCEGIVLKTAKSQSKIAMELLSMLPEKLLGEHYRIIPKSLGNLLGYELYGRILADTVHFQDTLRPITIMHCHLSVFEDLYDSVKIQNSSSIKVSKFIIECCGAISIEETNETKTKGKYIVVVPEDRVESARTAIGKMFQEFQQSGGRPAAMACLSEYQNYPLVNDNVTISGHAQRLSEKIRSRYQNRPKTPIKNLYSSATYSYHGSTIATTEQSPTTPRTPVPRSIRGIVKGKQTNNTNTGTIQQWNTSPAIQQQQQTPPTNQGEERTVMSNLSPDDSAKTMMTNVSRMVETLGKTLGTVVNTLATNNEHMAKATATTNNTMQQMMIQQSENMHQQAETMNAFMMLMTRNEARRQETPIQEIPIREIPFPIRETQPISTPTSTITNSQFSLSQQSTSANKRKIDGIADDETTAASTTMLGTEPSTEEDDVDAMLEEQSDAIEEIRTEQEEINDTKMTDIDYNPSNQNQQEQQEMTTNRNTTTIAAGDFSHQFSDNPKSIDTINNNTPTRVNRQ